MKPGKSALNPQAGAYVPLSKEDGGSAKPAAAATLHVQYQGRSHLKKILASPLCSTNPVEHMVMMESKEWEVFPGSQMHTPKTTSSSHNQQMREEKFDLLHESIMDTYLAY
ncbi:hypothetical protein Bca101_014199 [Brassica carinata]